ncbi:MAG: hypothetical protein SGJ11_08740 [Phycisphaerae bacterium]|nr:hypothetical protein [Phycisphaerae bacterium]
MAISGLVVTLHEDSAAADAAVSALSDDGRVSVGERFGRRVAIVAETGSVAEDRDLWDALLAIPGVEHLDVAYVALDPPTVESGGLP